MEEHKALAVNEAFAVNGRGGDKGIDIHLRRGEQLTIVQLKFFPEGFSGGFRKVRRDEIRASFKSAMQHAPHEWWLVVPNTVTLEERAYVEGLSHRNTPDGQGPSIVILDRPKLDALAAAHPDLVTYFKRDELREAAKDYNAERALLLDRDDVVARVAALAKQSDTLHPDWKLEFFTSGDIVGTKLVAKHPLAAERSPIKLTVKTEFGEQHQDLRDSFDRSMSFGTPGRIDLPAEVVSSFVVDGPEFIAERSERVDVTWWTDNRDQEPLPVSLIFQDERGASVASFPGKTTWRGAAARGGSLIARFCDTVVLEFLLPYDKTETVCVAVKVELAGARPSDIVAGVSLLERLEQGLAVVLDLDGDNLARLLTDGKQRRLFGEDRDGILTHREIAKDLLVVEGATNHHFTYPESVDFRDLVYVRVLRLLLEGNCVVLPEQREVTPKLNGKDGEHIRDLLTGKYVSLITEIENYGQVVFGQEVYVGHARVYAPQVHAIDPDSALAALDAGTAAGLELTIRARDDYGFWLFLPERYIGSDDDRLRPISLGIDGLPDAPDIARALESTPDVTES